MRLSPLVALLALSACVEPEPPTADWYPVGRPAAPPPPAAFWQDESWTVERAPLPGTRPAEAYCTATGPGGPGFALTETRAGLLGWAADESTGRAAPSVAYPVELRFGPFGSLPYMAYLQGPGRLVGAPAAPDVMQRLARDAAAAHEVALSSPALGGLGEYPLDGSRAALAELDRCARDR